MLSVVVTTWLLLQLPVALALGRFMACPQKRMKHPEASTVRRKTLARAA